MSYNPGNILAGSALTLQKNLNDREAFVEGFLKDPVKFNSLKNIGQDEKEALQLIDQISKSKKIYFCTYKNDQLNFWSSIRIVPNSSSAYKTGTSFIHEKNGYYQVVKKTEGNFSVLFFIPVKAAYRFQNQYLSNGFSQQLLENNYITFAQPQEKQSFVIKSLHQLPLFSVKLQPGRPSSYLAATEVVLWVLSISILFVLVYNLCTYIADKGYSKLAVLLAALFVLICIGINFFFVWLKNPIGKKLFHPLQLTHINASLFSMWDLALIIFFITWLAVFIFSNRNRLVKPVISTVKSYSLLLLMVLLLLALSVGFSNLFYELIIDSKVQFDIDNLLSLTTYNLLGAIMLCLAYLIFYLIAETCISISAQLNIRDKAKLICFLSVIVLITAWHIFHYHYFTWFYLLLAAIIIWRAYNVFYEHADIPATAFIVLLGLSSLIATIKLSHIQHTLEHNNRLQLVQKLVTTTDSNAEYIFQQVENNIRQDPALVRYFSKSDKNEVYLKNHLRKLYFADYLSKYDFKMYAYDMHQHNISGQQDYDLDVFQNLVLLGSLKVQGTQFFYRKTDAFGTRQYFALIPLVSNHELQGTLVVDLKSKSLENDNSFPPLLADQNVKQQDDFKNYSYAFYSDNRLLNQNGKFEYNLVNTEFKGKLKSYTELETTNPGFSHLIYQPNERKLVVVSIENKDFADTLSVFIFFFVMFLIFTLLVIAVYWFWSKIKSLNFNHFLWSLRVAANSLLYKTRIQISMVASVVFTLLIIGIVTFLTFQSQDRKQQDDLNHDKIKRIAADYEGQMMDSNIKNQEELELKFNAFAETYSVDLMLYDTSGVPLLYTQPKLYDYGLVGRRMNATAFIKMKRLQKSELLNDEEIGKFKFKSAYIPIYNAENEVVNFLQLPYFSNEAEYKARVGYFVNSMLNAYALVLVAIGLFAVFIAQKITSPLNLIQQGLTNTMYGRKTEPINWKRNDEIGSLIKEYNKMIASLELSANKLAKSERENAWREMAKQIAHEIKNPLTPLKLGLQLLQKSWKDKDPKFDQKFQKFSYSFVEQIESLSRIATEFSDFAKLPDIKPEVVNIFDIISRAANVFNQSDNMRIDYTPSKELYLIRVDKDQLLRCFNNLLKNAIEAMPPDRTGIITITYQLTKEHILVDIKDNGNGIPENIRENIFQPNFTTKSSGTGLGLAFIKNAIENTGGKIWFDTEIGIGTTFHLLFPSAFMPTVV
ncbi:sensor histidine kinase [Mucilaginibacter arboris]|uniref:histidine kinase n=1 Tax=Mucilaginibacter arboris TaxID=2682090 RepID=A0A7K1SVF2_9SPHI|nr:HAMP domain-containing sensor histidine kinase [Mucilaginibacter arboris]MVN21329.1 HAMP domain-containing protein [Mucilaginibacter arboris]